MLLLTRAMFTLVSARGIIPFVRSVGVHVILTLSSLMRVKSSFPVMFTSSVVSLKNGTTVTNKIIIKHSLTNLFTKTHYI